MASRAILTLFLLTVTFLPLSIADAEKITPAQARASVTERAEELVELNYFIVDDYFHQGKFEKCAELLGRVVALTPLDINAYSTAAWLLWSAKKTDEAKVYISRMIAAAPTDSMAFFEAGVFYMRLKDDDKTLRYLKKAVELGLPSPQRHLYGTTLSRLGHTEEALAFWKKVLAEDPKNEVAKQQIKKLEAKLSAPKLQSTPGKPAR